jgi:hypothetical protein
MCNYTLSVFIHPPPKKKKLFLFCLTFKMPLTVCAMDYSFLSCVSGTCLFLSFSSVTKVPCGDDVSPGWCSSMTPISPLCFSLFIDDMTEVLEFSKYHMYADNLQINHIAGRRECFLKVFVRLPVICLGVLK